MSEQDNKVVDFGAARERSAAKKAKQKAKAQKQTKRSKNQKIYEALQKHGSDEGKAIRDRFKQGKVDIFTPEKDKDDGVPSTTD